MSASAEFVAYIIDQLTPLGVVSDRPMFGGRGLFLGGKMFAMVGASGMLYLKADGLNREEFEAAGCEPFRYQRLSCGGDMRTVALSYYAAPEACLEESAALLKWARMSVDAASRAGAGQQGWGLTP